MEEVKPTSDCKRGFYVIEFGTHWSTIAVVGMDRASVASTGLSECRAEQIGAESR